MKFCRQKQKAYLLWLESIYFEEDDSLFPQKINLLFPFTGQNREHFGDYSVPPLLFGLKYDKINTETREKSIWQASLSIAF